MDHRIIISEEGPRGCGFRKEGGLYLRVDGIGAPCGRMPFRLSVCPCCGEGIKPARGWTWIDVDQLVADLPPCENQGDRVYCTACPLNGLLDRKAGLLWIGGVYYPTPAAWTEEAQRVGVSRRITTVPRGFEVGKTWVLAAHREVPGCGENGEPGPAIFQAFRPDRIEQIVSEEATEAEVDAIVKRGIVPVAVRRVEPLAEESPQLALGVEEVAEA